MAKHSTTTAWAAFPNRDDAVQAIQRLTSGGFARNSIDLDRQPDGTWNVAVHTGEHNLQRVERLLRSSSPMYAVEQAVSGPLQSLTANPLVVLGAAAFAGVVLYSLLHGRRTSTFQAIRRFPRRVWHTAQDVPDTLRDTAQRVQEAVTDLPETLRQTASTLTGRGSESSSR